MLKIQWKSNYFFIGLFSIFPVVDFLNGLLITYHISFPIGIIYRLLCCLLLLLLILKKGFSEDAFSYLFIFSLLLLLGQLLLQAIYLNENGQELLDDLATSMKLFLWLLFPYFFYQRKDDYSSVDIERMLFLISLFFTVCLLGPYFLGVGNSTYSNGGGYKGFFYANNDTTAAFIVVITFVGWLLVANYQRWNNWQRLGLFVLFGCDFFCLFLLGTKAGIIYAGGICFVYICWMLLKRKTTIFSRFASWLIIGGSFCFMLYQGFAYLQNVLAESVQRMQYFYHLYNDNLLQFLTSSRSMFLEVGWDRFLHDSPGLSWLFGYGFHYRMANWGIAGSIEMDFFDTLFSFGLVGLVLLTVLILFFVRVIWTSKKRGSIFAGLYGILLFYAFFAGHVFYSALSSTMLGLVCAGIILRKYEES